MLVLRLVPVGQERQLLVPDPLQVLQLLAQTAQLPSVLRKKLELHTQTPLVEPLGREALALHCVQASLSVLEQDAHVLWQGRQRMLSRLRTNPALHTHFPLLIDALATQELQFDSNPPLQVLQVA